MIPRRFSARALLAILALSTVAATPAHAAWPHNPTVNVPVCTAAESQFAPTVTSDGAGGAIVTWSDYRSASYDIYAQHLLGSGVADPAWPVNGRPICTAASEQFNPTLVSDGAGGAIVTWYDFRNGNYDIYAQRVLKSGVVDPAWPANGRALCTAAGDQSTPTIAADGAGGAIVCWSDGRGLDQDIYAQHVLSTGVVDAAWPVNGRAACTATGLQAQNVIESDGVGGALIAWADFRAGNSDIYAQHVLATGVLEPTWAATGSAVCVQPNDQAFPRMVADNAGGAILAWQDARSGTPDIYAHRLEFSVGVDGYWPTDGRLICNAANGQYEPRVASDGSGGAIIAWSDFRGANVDIYAQRVLLSSIVDPAWPVNGRVICAAASNQDVPTAVSDGAGGAVIAWQDFRNGAGFDIYAQHVLSSGAVDPIWPADGRALSTAPAGQENAVSASDGAGGMIVAWLDTRTGYPDIYAQRIARFGLPGTPEAEIASVRDVPNDQGGRAKVSWYASWVDNEVDPFSGVYEVNLYEVYRSVPTAAAMAAAKGSRVQASFAEPPAGDAKTFVVMPDGAEVYAWEYLATQSALHYIPTYSYLAATASDSVGTYNPKTVFMVVARNTAGSKYWLSRPDSGYSVDNVGPAPPAPFTGQYAGGTAHLHWNPNAEPDLAGYRLYRGTSPSFVPGPGNLVATPPDTGYADAAGAPYVYKLTAVDVHGNESPVATLIPSGTVGVELSQLPNEVVMRVWPNPASAALGLWYSMPHDSRVRLGVFDVAGRQVRLLVDGDLPAWSHALSWDLKSDEGRPLENGLYFVRLEADHRSLIRRLVIAR